VRKKNDWGKYVKTPHSPESLWAELPEMADLELISLSACAIDAAGSVEGSNWAFVPDMLIVYSVCFCVESTIDRYSYIQRESNQQSDVECR